jgi:hypothetical protein
VVQGHGGNGALGHTRCHGAAHVVLRHDRAPSLSIPRAAAGRLSPHPAGLDRHAPRQRCEAQPAAARRWWWTGGMRRRHAGRHAVPHARHREMEELALAYWRNLDAAGASSSIVTARLDTIRTPLVCSFCSIWLQSTKSEQWIHDQTFVAKNIHQSTK